MSQAVVALTNTPARGLVILEVMVPLVVVNIPNVPANLDTLGIATPALAKKIHRPVTALINTTVMAPMKPLL